MKKAYLHDITQISVDASQPLNDEQEAIANADIAEATMQIHKLKEAERVKHWSRREFGLLEFSTSKSKVGSLLMRSAG